MRSLFLRRIFFAKYCRSYNEIRRLCTERATSEENYCENESKKPHVPVMVNEVIENLNLKEGDKFLDMTFGAGGHSEALLKRYPNLEVFALDRDPMVKKYVEELQAKYPEQVSFLEGKFSDLSELLKSYDIEGNYFDGALFDLGCSSMQFDIAERGFSSNKDGPLDMRMDGDRVPGQITAADVVAYAKEKDLVKIFKAYGGEKNAVRIAKAIVAMRDEFQPLTTTRNLVQLIETVLKDQVRHDKLHRRTNIATKVFLALRIFINNEINELNNGLLLVHSFLKPGGRAVVLTFNSSEDVVVKRHFKNLDVDNCLSPLPLIYVDPNKVFTEKELTRFKIHKWESIPKKFVLPSEQEVIMNPRARSVKLRAAVKVVNQKVTEGTH